MNNEPCKNELRILRKVYKKPLYSWWSKDSKYVKSLLNNKYIDYETYDGNKVRYIITLKGERYIDSLNSELFKNVCIAVISFFLGLVANNFEKIYNFVVNMFPKNCQ